MTRVARAQAYPTKPVRIVVGFAAGGAPDTIGRLMAQWLSERLGQQFVMDNRPGAGGNIATEAVVRAPADGYTLLLATVSNAINATLYDKLNFNFIRDIAPVASLIRGPGVMVVNPSFPAKTIPEFIAYAKANPGKINMASAGPGSTPHLYGELFKMMAGVDLLHVPYRSQPQVLTDLIGGQLQVTFDPIVNSIEHIRAGRLAGTSGDDRRTLGVAAGPSNYRRIFAGLRGKCLARNLCAKKHARGNDRTPQQADQRRPCRCQNENADRRLGLSAICNFARRVRQVHQR